VTGWLHKVFPRKKGYIYCSLLIAMVVGRLVWGAAMFIVMGLSGGSFGLSMFLAGAVTNAIPGIIVQIVLVPLLVILLDKERATHSLAEHHAILEAIESGDPDKVKDAMDSHMVKVKAHLLKGL